VIHDVNPPFSIWFFLFFTSTTADHLPIHSLHPADPEFFVFPPDRLPANIPHDGFGSLERLPLDYIP
jgi:hypothetical protein